MTADRIRRRLAAILASDVVGYSRLMSRDEAGTHARLSAFRRDVFEPAVREFGGRTVKLMGDGALVEFPSVVDAVDCALAVQRAVSEAGREETGDRRIMLRIGIHLGDVIDDDNDIFGDGVNIAARLEGLAPAGGIAISEDALRQVEGKVGVGFVDAGEQRLKNIDRPVRVFHAQLAAMDALSEPGREPDAADKPSIAVLPFDNMSNDPEQDYFSDGITEDIITDLSRIPELLVISRNSTFTYKGKATKLQQVCRDLGVRYILEGSVRKAGGRVRINAQLIDGRSDSHLWAERYDRSIEDIFVVQDDVTARIVRALTQQLVRDVSPSEQPAQTGNIEAYDCVLRGRELYRQFSNDGNRAARALFEKAIALDPDYAEPYAGLAEPYVHDWLVGGEPTLDNAFEMAAKANALDPRAPLVNEALSTVYLFRRQHAEAMATARRWIDMEPSNAEAYANLAGAKVFAGDYHDVAGLIEQATLLNPIYPFYYPHYIGMANLMMRRFDAAAVLLRRAIERNAEALWPHVYLAAACGHLGRKEDATAEVAEIKRINPKFSVDQLSRLLPYKSSADSELLLDGLRKAGLPA